jgi:hypothetical protein
MAEREITWFGVAYMFSLVMLPGVNDRTKIVYGAKRAHDSTLVREWREDEMIGRHSGKSVATAILASTTST